jgi:hypothetical protein
MLKNTTSIDDISVQFNQFNLKITYEIKGFDPTQVFMKHVTSMGYNVSFVSTFLFIEEEGDIQNPQELSIEKKQDDIETSINTTKQYKHRGKFVNERSTQSPNTSQKIG